MHGFAGCMALMLGVLAMSAGALSLEAASWDVAAQNAAELTEPQGRALPDP